MLMSDTADLDAAFAALADPTRRAIVSRLAEGEATVNELAAPFAMSLPAVSKHLKVLERAGLISRRVDAQRRPLRAAGRRPRRDGPLRRAHTRCVGTAARPPRAVPGGHDAHHPIIGRTPDMTTPHGSTGSPLDHWALEREVVLTRVIAAPIERVYAAFTSPSIGEWFGPHGHRCTTPRVRRTRRRPVAVRHARPERRAVAEPRRVPRARPEHADRLRPRFRRRRRPGPVPSDAHLRRPVRREDRAEPPPAAPDGRPTCRRDRVRRRRARWPDARQAGRAPRRGLTQRVTSAAHPG
jgi:DNA-binding transcriptional ArsR family regulator